ncbi:MAG: LapA family protein [Calothrix sp. C42_A2020_038]|nr:LapA family protein [Calothrix sp. C42_A2020_038]
MAVIRLTILVVVLGGLTLLLAQNFSPALPLRFLGTQTQPFPLAMWLLFSTVAGATTSLIVSSLFGFAGLSRQPSPKSTVSGSRTKSYYHQDNTSGSEKEFTQSSQSNEYKSNRSSRENDWDLEAESEDWDFEEAPSKTTAPKQDKRDRRESDEVDERRQHNKAASQPDSSYSYSYREPKNSGVGKTESIYDADYRVIIPPYNPESNRPSPPPSSTQEESEDDDDWSFFDEDNGK